MRTTPCVHVRPCLFVEDEVLATYTRHVLIPPAATGHNWGGELTVYPCTSGKPPLRPSRGPLRGVECGACWLPNIEHCTTRHLRVLWQAKWEYVADKHVRIGFQTPTYSSPVMTAVEDPRTEPDPQTETNPTPAFDCDLAPSRQSATSIHNGHAWSPFCPSHLTRHTLCPFLFCAARVQKSSAGSEARGRPVSGGPVAFSAALFGTGRDSLPQRPPTAGTEHETNKGNTDDGPQHNNSNHA